MTISDQFDAVLMLTWSDWETEPRSNRYHYATRFAQHLPVLFLQHKYSNREGIEVRRTNVENIDTVDVNFGLTASDVREIRSLMNARGIKKPLLWIYDSINYDLLIEALPRAFRVYHATEDYLTPSDSGGQISEVIGNSVISLLKKTDLLIACSENVAKSCRQAGGYKGAFAIIENGCDAEFFKDNTSGITGPAPEERPVAIFQGGINQRLDYGLLTALATRMSDWEFHFCGRVVDGEGWRGLLALENVKYLGEMQPVDFAAAIAKSTVGLIPFIQDQWIRNSLPLKAFEYVACGLSVVTVPIDALEREPDHFAFATDSEQFERELRRLEPTRRDKGMLAKRMDVARRNSYDDRFNRMTEKLLSERARKSHNRSTMRIAVLYDAVFSMHVSTISEHLEAFKKYSRHSITYIPATPAYWNRDANELSGMVDFSMFDCVVLHYSTRLSVVGHLDEAIACALAQFNGLKILFIQDEYENTEVARSWMDKIQFDLAYTCVPLSGVDFVYPGYRYPALEFLPTLTGYVPEQSDIDDFALPLEQRKTLIAYRGRKLHAIYGDLGQEKYRIGVDMKTIAVMRDLPVDIEVDDSKRIYGDDWYRFLGSARATLGTESGSNIFDFNGDLKLEVERLKAVDPDISYADLHVRVLQSHEGRVKMNQVSPKVFEAIRLRTVLILFEGDYSGVLMPDLHFISLKKNFSNIDDVIGKIQDDSFVREMTKRAYEDVVASGKYSYRNFVESFDRDVERRILHSVNSERFMTCTVEIKPNGETKTVLPLMSSHMVSGRHPLGRPLTIRELADLVDPLPRPPTEIGIAVEQVSQPEVTIECVPNVTSLSRQPSVAFRMARRGWRIVPGPVRYGAAGIARKIARDARNAHYQRHPVTKVFAVIWRIAPSFVRRRVAAIINR